MGKIPVERKVRCECGCEIFLHLTDKGRELVRLHRAFDKEIIDNTTRHILETCTVDEIFTFYKVLNEYQKALLEYSQSK
jgi:DNA-binding MarR family transcriptional regulator